MILGAEKLPTRELLEQLRYVEVMGRASDLDTGPVELVYLPTYIGRPAQWAKQNVQRMASFDICAEIVYE